MNIIVLSLAVCRLTLLLTKEAGPLDVFGKLRRVVCRGTAAGDKARPGSMCHGVRCTHCVSLWVALLVTCLYLCWPTATCAACLPFALSMLSILVCSVLGH